MSAWSSLLLGLHGTILFWFSSYLSVNIFSVFFIDSHILNITKIVVFLPHFILGAQLCTSWLPDLTYHSSSILYIFDCDAFWALDLHFVPTFGISITISHKCLKLISWNISFLCLLHLCQWHSSVHLCLSWIYETYCWFHFSGSFHQHFIFFFFSPLIYPTWLAHLQYYCHPLVWNLFHFE